MIKSPSDTMDVAALRKERNELIKIARKAGLAPRTRGAGPSTAVPDVDMDEDDEVYQAKPATDDDSDDSGLGQTAEEVD